jgi:hypothetical protein
MSMGVMLIEMRLVTGEGECRGAKSSFLKKDWGFGGVPQL